MEQSCALTLALKFKLKTMRKAFKKFGRLLMDPVSGSSLPNIGKPSMKVKHDYKQNIKDKQSKSKSKSRQNVQ